MWYAILVALIFVASGVAFFLGKALKEAGLKAASLEASLKLQGEVLASFARAAKRRKALDDYIQTVESASTAADINELYKKLLSQT